MAIRPSSRASDAPTQWWMPRPKDKWLPSLRADIEPVRVAELFGIAVGAAQQKYKVVAASHRESVDFAILDNAA